jgi:hypothetical protein
MYRAGSLRAVGEEISKYRLDLLGVSLLELGQLGESHSMLHFIRLLS